MPLAVRWRVLSSPSAGPVSAGVSLHSEVMASTGVEAWPEHNTVHFHRPSSSCEANQKGFTPVLLTQHRKHRPCSLGLSRPASASKGCIMYEQNTGTEHIYAKLNLGVIVLANTIGDTRHSSPSQRPTRPGVRYTEPAPHTMLQCTGLSGRCYSFRILQRGQVANTARLRLVSHTKKRCPATCWHLTSTSQAPKLHTCCADPAHEAAADQNLLHAAKCAQWAKQPERLSQP
jgi:hypothetical protein